MAAVLATALAAAAAAAAGNAPYRWQNVTVGAGGFAPGIVFSRAAPGLAYLRTDMGGAYRWDDSARRWTPLSDAVTEGSYMGIESIAPDPTDADTVYAAAGMSRRSPAAILRSHDRGAHWQITAVPFRMGGNEDGRGLGERLAVDPHHAATLLFGSRHDGLWRSDDRGVHWARDPYFTYRGLGLPQGRATHGGIAFVLFDPRAGAHRVFAGVADAGSAGLYQSDDSGQHWRRLDGGANDLLPVKADMDARGTLYVAYANGLGPSGITKGAVWSLTADGAWRDITPDKSAKAPLGGYMGISADWQHPETAMVATIDRWKPVDTIWRTIDGGAHWINLGPISRRDVTATPFLKWGRKTPDFGHWMTGLAIDPFNASRAAYTTGATVYATGKATATDAIRWTPWVRGIEQTAIITLISPTGGAHLISGFGDLGGFVHDRLNVSPPSMFVDPLHANTNTLDYAGRAPNVIVRSGNMHDLAQQTAGLAWSGDGGHHWSPLHTPDWVPGQSLEASGGVAITVAADGKRFYVAAEHAWATSDRGVHWRRLPNVPGNIRIVADKVDPDRAWAIDPATGRLLESRDGGAHFAAIATAGTCADLANTRPRNRESQPALIASPFAAGELYLQCAGRLYRSRDGGAHFAAIGGPTIRLFGLGRAVGEDAPPAIYAIAGPDDDVAVWRTIDGGKRWARIDDARHHWGGRFRAISGDPRLAGRVYIATDGRGIVYGDPVVSGG